MGTHVCAQCNKEKGAQHFVGKTKPFVTWCSECRKLYKSAGGYGERGSIPRRQLRVIADEPNLIWAETSGNKKLGGIPASIVSAETCPPSCGFYGRGCYAEFGKSGYHWRRAQDGISWSDFITRVASLPAGQLWRHAVAGDLPGVGEALDRQRLRQLAEANVGKQGFTFTHKRLESSFDKACVSVANKQGFTINLSADTLQQADERAQLEVGPVAVVLPSDAPHRGLRTPAGRPVVVCPAQTRPGATCASCRLCARPGRTGVVGFLAHGSMKRTVNKIVATSVYTRTSTGG